MADDEALVKQILDDREFKQVLADYYIKRVSERVRASKA
jgi:hypothetical protein